MKNFIKNLIIVTLVFSFLALSSFFLFDFKRVSNEVREKGWTSIFTQKTPRGNSAKGEEEPNFSFDLEDRPSLNVSLLNGTVEFVEGPTYKLDIYCPEKVSQSSDLVEVSHDDKEVGIRGWTNKDLRLVVSHPHWSAKSTRVKIDNGEFVSSQSLDRLDARVGNGRIDLRGQDSYPIEAGVGNGEIKVNLGRIDGKIRASVDFGLVEVFGETKEGLGDSIVIEREEGQGKDPISLDVGAGQIFMSRPEK